MSRLSSSATIGLILVLVAIVTAFSALSARPARAADGWLASGPADVLASGYPPVAPQTTQVAPRFQAYYDEIDGLRLLGGPLSDEVRRELYPSQFFEKGVLEDHSAEFPDNPTWRLMYGLLVDELQNAAVTLPVGGDRSTVTYADLHRYAAPELRSDPRPGSTGGIEPRPGGSVFVPYTADLGPAPGHIVPQYFWQYLNRAELFPSGWLHDIGLPMTAVLDATVDKGDMRGRQIKIQAFQRTVLTYDPRNPAEWQIERANVGRDYLTAFPFAGT